MEQQEPWSDKYHGATGTMGPQATNKTKLISSTVRHIINKSKNR